MLVVLLSLLSHFAGVACEFSNLVALPSHRLLAERPIGRIGGFFRIG